MEGNNKFIFNHKKKFIIITTLLIMSIINPFNHTGAAPNYAKTVEGNGYYFSTGEAFPSHIQIVGFDTRDPKSLFLNIEFTTTKSVTTNVKFDYQIEIFDGTGNLIGGAGNEGIPLTAQATFSTPPTTATANANNVVANLGINDLPASHRIVVTVLTVTVNE